MDQIVIEKKREDGISFQIWLLLYGGRFWIDDVGVKHAGESTFIRRFGTGIDSLQDIELDLCRI